MVASTVAPALRAPSSSAIRRESTSAASLPLSRLRASASISASPGTEFRAVPPRMSPTLDVVSASMRPSLMRPMAAAAAAMALMPCSGAAPACAALPMNRAWIEQ
jgi:hypothetical protein